MDILRFAIVYQDDQPVELRIWRGTCGKFAVVGYSALRQQAIARHAKLWHTRTFNTTTGYYVERTNPAVFIV